MRKKIIIGIGILLLVGLLIGAILIGTKGGKYSSPEKTFYTAINAVKEGNVETYLSCFTEVSQKWLKESKTEITSEFLKTGAPKGDVKVESVEKEGDTATLGSSISGSQKMILTKIDGKWKIDLEKIKQKTIEKNQEN